MDLSTAFASATAVLKRRPGDLLPLYLLTSAVPVITRVITFAGLIGAFAYLELTNRMDTIRTELAMLELDLPSPETEPDAFVEWAESLFPILELLFSPAVLAIIAITFVITVLVAVILSAGLVAGQLAACYARLNDQRGLTAAIRGVQRWWFAILVVRLFEFGLWFIITFSAVAVVAGSFAISPLLAVFVGLFVAFGWIALGICIRAVFVFVPVSIIVDGNGPVAALRHSVEFIRHNFAQAVGYYVIAIGVLFGLLTATGVVAPIGGAGLVSIIGVVLVTPGLDLFKIALYGDYSGTISPPTTPTSLLRDQILAGTRFGWQSLGSFVRSTPGLHVLASACIIGGFGLGWIVAEPFEEIITTSIESRLVGIIPPIATLEFGANNWLVTLTMAYAGIAMGIPTAVSLGFNGFVFGFVARLETAPLVLILFVIPHGIFELPALIIAGALGFSLGVTTWRTLRGRASREVLADALENAFWVLIGIGLLIVAAAFIEGFISPFYFRLIV